MEDRGKNIRLCWVPSYCNVSGNERADREAKAAATDLTIPMHSEAIPYEDMRAIIKNRTKMKWQRDWERIDQVRGRSNKLRQIKDSVIPWATSKKRKYEVILTNLLIGHSLLTHGHLIAQRPQPYCEDCLVPLSIKHVMIECPSYQAERRLLLCISYDLDNAETKLKQVLGNQRDFNVGNIMGFLRRTELYSKI